MTRNMTRNMTCFCCQSLQVNRDLSESIKDIFTEIIKTRPDNISLLLDVYFLRHVSQEDYLDIALTCLEHDLSSATIRIVADDPVNYEYMLVSLIKNFNGPLLQKVVNLIHAQKHTGCVRLWDAALYAAVCHGHVGILKYIMDKKLAETYVMPFYEAVRKGPWDIIKCMLDISFRTPHDDSYHIGSTALGIAYSIAIDNDDLKTLQKLLTFAKDKGLTERIDMSFSLYAAARRNNMSILGNLLKKVKHLHRHIVNAALEDAVKHGSTESVIALQHHLSAQQ